MEEVCICLIRSNFVVVNKRCVVLNAADSSTLKTTSHGIPLTDSYK